MKNILCVVNITKQTHQRGCRFTINNEVRNILGNEIVIDVNTLTIKRPTLDTKHTHSIKSGNVCFSHRTKVDEEFIGKYNLIQLDEDTFILKKVKDVQKFN